MPAAWGRVMRTGVNVFYGPNYHNPDFERMVDEAQTVMDPKKRLEHYHRINRFWVEDAAAMPLYQQVDLYGVTKRMVWKARGDERVKGFDMAVK